METCSSCGSEILESSKNCPNCGTKIMKKGKRNIAVGIGAIIVLIVYYIIKFKIKYS